MDEEKESKKNKKVKNVICWRKKSLKIVTTKIWGKKTENIRPVKPNRVKNILKKIFMYSAHPITDFLIRHCPTLVNPIPNLTSKRAQ